MNKIGDVVLFLSKDPISHLNMMFGHGTFLKENKEKEYVGVITNVHSFKLKDGIAFNSYTAYTTRPLEGFICLLSESQIIKTLSEDEWTEDERRCHQKLTKKDVP